MTSRADSDASRAPDSRASREARDSARPGPGQGAVRREDDGRLERGRRTRERLRQAARELILERGFDRATLRAVAGRAGMGPSSIYRHLETKEELLLWELADLQDEAWQRFRRGDDRSLCTRERIRRFFAHQHDLLARQPDYTVIALRATTHPGDRIARESLRLTDRAVGLVAEILQSGRKNGDLRPGVDLLSAAAALCQVAVGARVSWANGRLTEQGCRQAIETSVDLLFSGIGSDPEPIS
jgi:AcrR family transcriptional regulator